MILKTPRRLHLLKTATWRVSASLTTFIISWIVTGQLTVGLTIGIVDAAVKTFLYYGHERAWFRYAQGHPLQE